eukprot:2163992-Pyramimonas_sp.AAC.1
MVATVEKAWARHPYAVPARRGSEPVGNCAIISHSTQGDVVTLTFSTAASSIPTQPAQRQLQTYST